MEETNNSTKGYKELRWSDGIIFKGLRRIVELSRSNKARTVWIVFDGRLTSHFTGIVETLMLESPRMIQSPINDNIYLPRNIK